MSSTLDEQSRVQLEEERDFLLRSLDDLEAEWVAGDIDHADYLALKDEYTARAAAALRAIDGAGEDKLPGTADDAQTPEAERRRWLKPLAGVAIVVAFAVGAGALVARSAGERLPGDPATGEIDSAGPTTRLARDLAQARQLVGQGKTLDAIKVYDQVLERHPDQVEALAYRGWLVRLAGRQSGNQQLLDRGLDYLNRAVAADPRYPDAHFFRGLMLYQDRADPVGAVTEFRAFLDNDPPREMVSLVEDVLRRAEADAQAKGAGPPPPG